MTDANQNPPSEREWSIEDAEEFFSSQDAVTGLLGGGYVANASLSFGAITLSDIQEMVWNLEVANRGIRITSITPPEQGWPIAMHCPICKETTFALNTWAVKPSEGDYFLINDVCAHFDSTIRHRHSMELAMPKIEYKPIEPLREWPWPWPRMMSFTQMMPIEEAKKRWPNEMIEGEKK